MGEFGEHYTSGFLTGVPLSPLVCGDVGSDGVDVRRMEVPHLISSQAGAVGPGPDYQDPMLYDGSNIIDL